MDYRELVRVVCPIELGVRRVVITIGETVKGCDDKRIDSRWGQLLVPLAEVGSPHYERHSKPHYV